MTGCCWVGNARRSSAVLSEPNVRSTSNRHAHPPGEPPDFLFVDNFDYGDGTFSDRPYAISLNVAIPDHDRLRRELAWRLADAGVVDEVAVEGFGEEPPSHVEIHVGDDVPVAIVQAVLDVYGHLGRLPVRAGISDDDGGFGNRQRIYVGSLVESVPRALTAAQLEAVLAPALSADALHRLLPAVPED